MSYYRQQSYNKYMSIWVTTGQRWNIKNIDNNIKEDISDQRPWKQPVSKPNFFPSFSAKGMNFCSILQEQSNDSFKFSKSKPRNLPIQTQPIPTTTRLCCISLTSNPTLLSINLLSLRRNSWRTITLTTILCPEVGSSPTKSCAFRRSHISIEEILIIQRSVTDFINITASEGVAGDRDSFWRGRGSDENCRLEDWDAIRSAAGFRRGSRAWHPAVFVFDRGGCWC